MRRASFKPQIYNNALVGALFLVLAAIAYIVPFWNDSVSYDLMPTVLSFLVGILMIGQTMLSLLIFTDDAMIVRGILPRTMLYADIASVEWGRVTYKSSSGGGYVGCVVLTSKKSSRFSKKGRRLKIVPLRFTHYEGAQGWAAILLQVIGSNTITTDTNIRTRLESAVARAKPSQLYTDGRPAL